MSFTQKCDLIGILELQNNNLASRDELAEEGTCTCYLSLDLMIAMNSEKRNTKNHYVNARNQPCISLMLVLTTDVSNHPPLFKRLMTTVYNVEVFFLYVTIKLYIYTYYNTQCSMLKNQLLNRRGEQPPPEGKECVKAVLILLMREEDRLSETGSCVVGRRVETKNGCHQLIQFNIHK